MANQINQIELLSILAAPPLPSMLIESKDIAERPHMSLHETRQAIKCLNDTGVIQSDMDAELSLITHKGPRWLKNYQNCISHQHVP